MSSFQPFIDSPFPNFSMEELLYADPVQPVTEVTPVPEVRPAETVEERPAGEAADAAELSSFGRRLAEAAAAPEAAVDTAALARSARNNRAIRELAASLADYDNTAAQRKFDSYLRVLSNYGPEAAATAEDDSAVAAVRAQLDAAYAGLGFMAPGSATTTMRRHMAEAIDQWLAGLGVFVPSMLTYSSGDGFRFSPLTAASKASLRAAETLASYEQARVARYLRYMAELTPQDFLIYDPTELRDLALNERRQFLQRMDELLAEARIDARAADLRYVFNNQGELQLEELGLEEEEAAQLEASEAAINNYYAILAASVMQYGSGIISEGLA